MGDAVRRAERVATKAPSIRKAKRVTREQIASLYPNYPRDSQIRTFHAAMGRAIAAWQAVETWLYEVYRATTASRRPGAEACAFFSVHAFQTKLSLTSAAVQFTLQDDVAALALWKTLAKKARTKANRRNEIAHGAVWTQFHETRRDRKIYIGPNMMDFRDQPRKQPNQDTEPLTLKRMRGYEKDFCLLGEQFRRFSQRIPPPEASAAS